MFYPAYLLAFGVALLLSATHLFIKQSERFSASVRISPLIIGLTVVSIGTSLPELAVSLVAILRGDPGLAMGNIIGSNVINILLVLGLGILFGHLRVGTTKTQLNMYILLGVTAAFLFLHMFGATSNIAAVVLLYIAVIVTYGEYRWGVRGRKLEDVKLFRKRKPVRFRRQDYIAFGCIILSVIVGGVVTVEAVEQMSKLVNFSTTVLGLSVTAIATSLPELLATFYSEEDGDEKLAIGNIIGSNIYNLALIGGLLMLFSATLTLTGYETVTLAFATFLFFSIIVFYKGRIIPKYVGFILLSLFGMYIYYLR